VPKADTTVEERRFSAAKEWTQALAGEGSMSEMGMLRQSLE
jgi:hypothetical protein